jgi:hypothetical protein
VNVVHQIGEMMIQERKEKLRSEHESRKLNVATELED